MPAVPGYKKINPRPEGWAGIYKKGGEEHMKNVVKLFNLGVLSNLQLNCNLFETFCQGQIVKDL